MLQRAPDRAQGSQRDCDAMGRQRIAHARCEFSKFIRDLQLRNIDLETHGLRGFAPRVAVMKPADSGHSKDLGVRRRPRLNSSMLRCIPKTSVDAIAVVVADVFPEQPSEMVLVENDDMVEQLSPNSSCPSFGKTILPGTSQGGWPRLHPKLPDRRDNLVRENRVVVMDQESSSRAARKGIAQLLSNPRGSRVLRDVAMQEFATPVVDGEPYI